MSSISAALREGRRNIDRAGPPSDCPKDATPENKAE
jgi:hypothetical protein